jgi:hypothetical protein
MAKSKYGVTTLGGSGGNSGGGSGKNYAGIARTFAKGGYLPDALEHGGGEKYSGRGVKSISDIAGNDKSTGNDIFTSFRKK